MVIERKEIKDGYRGDKIKVVIVTDSNGERMILYVAESGEIAWFKA